MKNVVLQEPMWGGMISEPMQARRLCESPGNLHTHARGCAGDNAADTGELQFLLGFGVLGFGFKVLGLGFKVYGFWGSRIWGRILMIIPM